MVYGTTIDIVVNPQFTTFCAEILWLTIRKMARDCRNICINEPPVASALAGDPLGLESMLSRDDAGALLVFFRWKNRRRRCSALVSCC